MPRHSVLSLALVATTVFSALAHTPAQAQTRPIPFELARKIEQSPSNAIEEFGRIMSGISDDGTISEVAIQRHGMASMAYARAKVLEEILALDLDGDGVVTDLEVEASFAVGQSSRRRSILLIIAKADANADKAISYDEMRSYAAEVVRNRNNAHDYGERAYPLLALDLDADGILTIREMVEAVQRFSPKCSCVE